MKDSTNAKEKTSRRSFAKSVATALVAAPVVSSLSSCAKPQDTTNSSSPPSGTSPYLTDSGNPPVIIDGGSLSISSPATLEDVEDTETTPKKYDHKYRERNKATLPLGAIKRMLLTNDYGDPLLDRTLQSGETLKVYLWIQKVKEHGETGNDDDDTDVAQYDNIANQAVPEVIIQGGALEIRSDREFSKDRKLFKRANRNPKRRQRNDWDPGHAPFRIARVKVLVNDVEVPPSPFVNADKGFRITLIFP